MNERIKKLRKALDLTQAEFAVQIGTSQNSVANYEIGHRNPSSSVINNICKTFNVNEEWLRTGDGSMFKPKARSEEITAFVNRVCADDSDSFKFRLIAALSRLGADEWAAAERFALSLVADRLPKEDVRIDIDAEVAAYRAELEAQQKGLDKSLASPTAKDA